jgi:hypothetical protein
MIRTTLTKKRNGHSESCGEDPVVRSAASGSPYSDHYSGDELRMLLTPTEEDDDDMMDGPDDDDLLDEDVFQSTTENSSP